VSFEDVQAGTSKGSGGAFAREVGPQSAVEVLPSPPFAPVCARQVLTTAALPLQPVLPLSLQMTARAG
jgi:hypothetical protein